MGLTLADLIPNVSVSGVSSGEVPGEVRAAVVLYMWLFGQWLTLINMADGVSQQSTLYKIKRKNLLTSEMRYCVSQDSRIHYGGFDDLTELEM